MTPSRRGRLTLAERSARSGAGEAASNGRSAGSRHCWVTGLPGQRDRCPGLLAEWRDEGGHWSGRVVYAIDDGGRIVLVEAWVPSEHLTPAGG
jgi:hypothetical protein